MSQVPWFRLEFQPPTTSFPDLWIPWAAENNTLQNRPGLTFLTRKEALQAIGLLKHSGKHMKYRIFKIDLDLIESGEVNHEAA